MFEIRKAAVLGSGVMGAAIAAHLANAGLQVALLDIAPQELTEEEVQKGLTLQDKAVRNRVVMKARDRIKNPKSLCLFIPQNLDRITFGNFEDDLSLLSGADWVIEAIVENLDIKQDLLQKITPFLKKNMILSSNTSGISINTLCEALPESLRDRFAGTHFFNPPRFMKLMELIPAQSTGTEILDYLTEFCEVHLGKGVVRAKDTPGFIANRVGAQALNVVMHKRLEHGLSIEEADALTGGEIGRPRTGTFRLLDMVGLDTALNVTRYLKENVHDEVEKRFLETPADISLLQENGYYGDKSHQGFYKKADKETLVIVPGTLDYRPRQDVVLDSLNQARAAGSLQEKLNILVYAEDKAGKFVWDVIKRTLLFSAGLIPEVAADTRAIDDALKWGYNWEAGPFELWDLIGVKKSVARMKAEGEEIPPLVTELLAAGRERFYEAGIRSTDARKLDAPQLKVQARTIISNSHASLVEMGDDVACCLIHSPNSSITDELVEFMQQAVSEVESNFKGLVLTSLGKNFCVGANLPDVLAKAREKDWAALGKQVDDFQNMNMMMKYCTKPVVAAPFAMTLGGGAEMVMHTAKVRAFAETGLGLVEAGVGVLPAGGGTKEMLIRAIEAVNDDSRVDVAPFILKTLETITRAKVSGSAPDAIRLGYLRKTDSVAMNKDLQLFQAKQDVLELSKTISSPDRELKYRVGGEVLYALLQYNLYQMKEGGFISEYDAHIGAKIAYVLTGGRVGSNTPVGERYLLDLEKEAFLSLCGEAKTQERIEYMLKKGKPLRN